MATRSSILAWRIPGTAEPGGLPSMGSHRVGHDWSGLAAAETESRVMDARGWGTVEIKSSSKDIISVLQDEKNSGDCTAI